MEYLWIYNKYMCKFRIYRNMVFISIEREYIKKLLTELDNIESYQNLYEDLENKHADLILEKNELEN